MFKDEWKCIKLYDSTKLYSLAVIINTYYVNALKFYYVDIYNHYVYTTPVPLYTFKFYIFYYASRFIFCLETQCIILCTIKYYLIRRHLSPPLMRPYLFILFNIIM